ncbi:MAG: hypothetical protein GEV07_12890 [Streptosporangiales bacterium]|nr:hypothetical protein [Streptosporangiales bacterium]
MSTSTERPTVLRRAPGALGGEVVLRARTDGEGEPVHELIVDGVFAMDTVHTATERLLATAVLDRVAGDALTVAVGGLGLGYTVRALLDEPRVGAVEVVELEPNLVEWLSSGVVPGGAELMHDPRVRVRTGDVRAVLPTLLPAESVDCVLLDVDNGPLFLVHGANAPVYEEPFLAACLARLRPGGVLAVWSADPAPALHRTLTALAASCDEIPLQVAREGRTFSYALYLATR